jgi:methionyl-tRNA formyltransferase
MVITTMNKKIFITNNKSIGLECKQWAKNNLPDGFEITDNVDDCDVFISILYDKILNKNFLQNKECYNFHPAILPNYAGVGTMTWSILNKETEHGITLHLIDEGIDTGDIIEVNKFKIDEDETSHSLYEKTMKKMLDFFKKKWYIILNGDYKTYKQDFSKRKVYTYKDLDNLLNLSNYMRATYFPNKSKPYYYKREKKVEINIEF